ncbi:kinase-like protein [Aspergillus sclerotiicarbonarius CBS 121057]|uniref:non-specific serine/threonine protein kinase n=1 Tax=Aspergillus sclerotiicarbonarius (strain CBS 121057 / IBT 28362) TaxID=1448318 RepID=A0A319EER6_ASPSB|nr:kinase-like protein [Aspergillus sclerotiicarbonarius CBS 121057]
MLRELKKTYKSRKCCFSGRGRVLGYGSFGRARVVYKRNSKDKAPYVVKEFFRRPNTTKRVLHHQIRHEYAVTRRAHHPNVVKVVDLCTRKDELSYVMEYCDQGDLHDLIDARILPFKEQLCLFKQLLRGVANLHSQGAAHLDLKPGNLLINSDSVLKIADFGFCHIFKDPSKGPHHFVRLRGGEVVGTEPYLPPEVFYHGVDYDPRKVDVWCCANVALLLNDNGFPWQKAREDDLDYKLFVEGWRQFMRPNIGRTIDPANYPYCGKLSIPEHYPSIHMMVLILKMLNPNPRHRITIHQALNDPVVRAIECCSPAYYPTDGRTIPGPSIKHDHRLRPAPPRSGRRGPWGLGPR